MAICIFLCSWAFTALIYKLMPRKAVWFMGSLGVVMAAGGYPGDYRTGDVIHGLPLEEVAAQNQRAVAFYHRHGFVTSQQDAANVHMTWTVPK